MVVSGGIRLGRSFSLVPKSSRVIVTGITGAGDWI